MDPSELILGIYMTLLYGGMTALVWARLNRLETKMDTLATRDELHATASAIRGELHASALATREEVHATASAIRGELHASASATRDELHATASAIREDLRVSASGTREEVHATGLATREDLNALRNEVAIMRSDLTQVALAVGARPRASGD